MPRSLPPHIPHPATISAMAPRRTPDVHLHAPSPTLPLHDHTDGRRETAILAEVDSGYPWND